MKIGKCFGSWLRKENSHGIVNWRGIIYDEFDNQIDPIELVSFDDRSLIEKLKSCSGFYAIIIERDGYVVASVDAIRSIPIFYSGDVSVSDSAEWIMQSHPEVAPDNGARAEFLLSGYVTGNRTLWADIKQLRAGEAAIFHEGHVELHRYIEFDHKAVSDRSREELSAQLDKVLDRIFRRLIAYADGRQIVVPLSGGYDSRLIVTMLKVLGYENVLCFSYGVPGNAESVTSKAVAQSLGYGWLFVEYTDDEWRSSWSSSDASLYRAFASGQCSLPNMQDWLAISKLVKGKCLQEGCVIVPGHTGDFITGGFVTEALLHPFNWRKKRIVNYIIDNHFSNAPVPSPGDLNALRNTIYSALGNEFESEEGVAREYEKWVWEERQAKYIANAVRVYDHFDLDWWMPLWDASFIAYWNSVPLAFRIERKFAINYVQTKYMETAKISHMGTIDEIRRNKVGVRYAVKLMIPRSLSLLISRMLRRRRLEVNVKNLENNPLCLGSLIPRGSLRPYLSKGYNVIGIYSKLHLDGEWGDVG